MKKNSCLPPDTDRQSLTDCLMDCFFPPNKYEYVNYLRFLIYRGYEVWGKYNNDLYREINSKFYKQSANFIF